MKTISQIFNFLFGKKYYANIIGTLGSTRYEISCFIFRTKEEANEHRDRLMTNRTYYYVETITFRSHEDY